MKENLHVSTLRSTISSTRPAEGGHTSCPPAKPQTFYLRSREALKVPLEVQLGLMG